MRTHFTVIRTTITLVCCPQTLKDAEWTLKKMIADEGHISGGVKVSGVSLHLNANLHLPPNHAGHPPVITYLLLFECELDIHHFVVYCN